ncbi:MAG: ATP-dependent Clp protease adaptor ClpS [Candidatus Eremiobacterota bacterium]
MALTTPTLPALEQQEEQKTKPEKSWRVILYNDDIHAFDDVVLWVQKATGYSHEMATQITDTANRTGRSVCYKGDKEDCGKVCRYLRGHGLQVELDDF